MTDNLNASRAARLARLADKWLSFCEVVHVALDPSDDGKVVRRFADPCLLAGAIGLL